MAHTNGTAKKSSHGVIVLGNSSFSEVEVKALATQHAKVEYLHTESRAQIIKRLSELAPEGGWDSVLNFGGAGLVNKELLGALEGQLGFVAGMGAGFDGVDLDWLSSIGVYYSNAPTGVADPVAATAAMMILMCTRNAIQADQTIRRGEWRKGFQYIQDTRGFVVGILGMGKIGKLTRDKCMAFGMKVIYHNRKRLPESEEKGATYVSFEDLLKESQVITIHCSLSTDTFHLFGAKEFAAMRKGVYIINTSRGKVIDEEALVAALKSGQVDRAGLDCFEEEPTVHPYLLTCDRVSLYPHQAGASARGIKDKEIEVLTNLETFVKDGKPRDAVNHPVGK